MDSDPDGIRRMWITLTQPRLARAIALGLAAVLGPCSSWAAQPQPGAESERLLYFLDESESATLANGRRLHIVCAGTGTPTVILTAGLTGNVLDWNLVQPQVSRTTRVCAWDRPGTGLSDGTGAEQTVTTTTLDLEAALASRSIQPPYVMVGHSLGAYETLLFADRNPAQVAGMVLVDPSMPDQQKRFERLFTPELIRSRLEPLQRSAELLRSCARGMREKNIAPADADAENCLRQPGWYPPRVAAAIQARAATPAYLESTASFLSSSPQAGALVVNARRDYGNLPLIVLTAQNVTVWPGMSESDKAAMTGEWNRSHDELAALSTRGVNALVTGAGHSIQVDQPQAVVDAIESIVRDVRERQ